MAKTKSSRPKVSVIIPSWNSEIQLKKNLPYVFLAAQKVKAEIIIIDDASTADNSIEYLKSLGDKINLFQNKKNLGYANTVNRAVKLAKGNHVVLFNTDVIPSTNCISNALRLFQDDTVFAVTFNSGEAWAGAQWTNGMFQHFKVEPNNKNKNVQNPSLWASGGQGIFDRNKWLKLGGMDDLYAPFYWEDVDLGYRAWKRGWRIIWDPDSCCVHDHEQSVIAANFKSNYIKQIAQRNQFVFIWKNIFDYKMLISHLLRLPSLIITYPQAFFQALLLLPQFGGLRALS